MKISQQQLASSYLTVAEMILRDSEGQIPCQHLTDMHIHLTYGHYSVRLQ